MLVHSPLHADMHKCVAVPACAHERQTALLPRAGMATPTGWEKIPAIRSHAAADVSIKDRVITTTMEWLPGTRSMMVVILNKF